MPELFQRLTQLAENAISRLTVHSALNPCLWLVGLTMPFGVAMVLLSSSLFLQITGVALIFFPLVFFGVGFIYFMLTNPDKLRSEDYELRRTALALIEQKGGNIAIAEASVQAISNPDYVPQLKPPKPGDNI
jgi:amino acid permease